MSNENKIPSVSSQSNLTVYPSEVVFKDVQPFTYYEIPLFVRNDGTQIQKVRLIPPPSSSVFSLKPQQALNKTLAPGLALKIPVFFSIHNSKIQQQMNDFLHILGTSFKKSVPLKAFTPSDCFSIPPSFSLGRVLLSNDCLSLPIKNTGKRAGTLSCSTRSTLIAIPKCPMVVQPDQTASFPINIIGKKVGYFQEQLCFSNDQKCMLQGTIVPQTVDLFGQNGQRFTVCDLGQIFVGQKVTQEFHILNNTQQPIDCFFKTFSRNFQPSELKVDNHRGTFVVRSQPQQYARQMQSCCSSVGIERSRVEAFSQMSNRLTVGRTAQATDLKTFQAFAMDANSDQISQQAIIENLLVKTTYSNGVCRVPIKFIMAFPRLKISSNLLEFGTVRQRKDQMSTIVLHNQDQTDLPVTIEHPSIIKVEGPSKIEKHSKAQYKVCLRAIRPGQIQQSLKFVIFQGLYLEVKVFAQCKGCINRPKDYLNQTSTRNMSPNVTMYRSICSQDKSSRPFSHDKQNKTATLSDLRLVRLNKLLKTQITMENVPCLMQPQLSLKFNSDDYKRGNIRMRKIQPQKDTHRHLTLKQVQKSSKPLSLQNLANITLSISQLAFGSIFVDAQVRKEMTLCNNNPIPILFQWNVSANSALSGTDTELTHVEPYSQKTFSLIFKPNAPGAVSFQVGYVINKTHSFQLPLSALVTLVCVEVFPKALQMKFEPQQAIFQKSQSLRLHNRGVKPIQCVFKFNDNKHFYTSCDSMKIAPKQSQMLRVFYKPKLRDSQEDPNQQRTDADRLTIKVIDGAQTHVKCQGKIKDCRVTVKQSQFSWSQQLVSVPILSKLSLRNLSLHETVYKAECSANIASWVTFEKDQGLLAAEQRKQIVFRVLCQQARKIQGQIKVFFRGGKCCVIPLQCTFVFPEIEVSRTNIDFGNIPVMGSNYLECITVINRYKNQLRLEYSRKFENQQYSVQIRQPFRTKTQRSLPDPQILRMKKKSSTFRDDNKSKQGSSTQKFFRLVPNKQVILEIRFIPKVLRKFQLRLPLRLIGTNLQPLPVNLLCSGIEPVVYLQPHKVKFDTCIIGDSRTQIPHYFKISNPHQRPIGWWVDQGQDCRHGIFCLSEWQGKIGPKQSVEVAVVFRPEQQGHFSEQMKVLLRQEDDEDSGPVSHIQLWLQGSAISPSIKFNCNQLLMRASPVGVQSKAVLLLQNHGYDSITISKWRISTTFPALQVQLFFPQGRLLSLTKKHLKVEVVCQASEALSITTVLEFYDEFGNRYQLPLSCTFDRSLMTSYPYFECQQKPVIVIDKRSSSIKLGSCPPHILDRSQHLSASQLISCDFVKNWLNFNLSLGLEAFPLSLRKDCQLFSRMVNKMSKSELIERYQSGPQTPLYPFYCQALKKLKIQGAFLNQIRPQHLLSYEDYLTLIHARNSRQESQQAFEVLSVEAWTALFYQLCKLYVLPSITAPSVGKLVTSHQLTCSFCSTHQLLLVRFLASFRGQSWIDLSDQQKVLESLQLSMQKIFGVNFNTDRQNIQKSMNSMRDVAGPAVATLPARVVYSQLVRFGLDFFLTQTDLYSLGSKELLLFLVSYVNSLHIYSSPSSLRFQGAVGDRVTRVIEIENSNTRKVKYLIKIVGSQQFQSESQQLLVAGKSKNQLRVVYNCRQNKQDQAKLLLVPAKENSHNISPLCFKLSSFVLSKITLKKINVSAELYEVTTVALDVDLPIDIIQMSEFNITLHQSQKNTGFYCFQQMNRVLRSNKDKIQIKLVPLTSENKFCRVCYWSPVYGQFNFQISAKIQPPSIFRDIQLRQLKANRQQIVSLHIPKQNEKLQAAIRFLSEHHVKLDHQNIKTSTIISKGHSFSIVQSSYISVSNSQCQRQGIRVDLLCSFAKPFQEYTCTLLYRNQNTKDLRYYRLVVSVCTRPHVVNLTLTAKARCSTTLKIPITNAPCDCVLENPHPALTLTNFNAHLRAPCQLTAVFSPQWLVNQTVTLLTQNRENMSQVVYQIQLMGEQPTAFDHIKLQGSAFFPKKVKVPICLIIREELSIVIESSRIQIEGSSRFMPHQKYISVVVMPNHEEESSIIKLVKPTGQYFWAAINISNQAARPLSPVTLSCSPLETTTLIMQEIALGADYSILLEPASYLSHRVMGGKNPKLQLRYSPLKQMEKQHQMLIMASGVQYCLKINCQALPFAPIVLPNLHSQNLQSTTTAFVFHNPFSHRAQYNATIQPSNARFAVDCHHLDLKSKQKKEISVHFLPSILQIEEKATLILSAPELPTYTYRINGISSFNDAQIQVKCEFQDQQEAIKDILFTNHFGKKELFFLNTHFEGSPFDLIQPNSKSFQLAAGATKKILIKIRGCKGNDQTNKGSLGIRVGQKQWVYHLMPVQIKMFSKKCTWTVKAREVFVENIQLPEGLDFQFIESPPEIHPYLSFSKQQGSRILKIKYSPMKPLPKQTFSLLLVGNTQKYTLQVQVSVSQPDFDDTILIKTKQVNQVGAVTFKLTNTKKQSAPYQAYLLNRQPDLTLVSEKGILEPYGRVGTPIQIRFASQVFNKRVQDQLWVETQQMVWRFKVRGLLSKNTAK